MATYAIGDIQGCFLQLKALLKLIQFDVQEDTLWFTGDLVNRGPQSLEVLRFVSSLGDRHQVVLGNHDLHLLFVGYISHINQFPDTFNEILKAKDMTSLLDWLRYRPLLRTSSAYPDYLLVHAGIAPMWDKNKALQLAKEVETVLQGNAFLDFLYELYGNEPSLWMDDLTGNNRLRSITNYFTRMRFCDKYGGLDLSYKGDIAQAPSHLLPWFQLANRLTKNDKIIFGHWAALMGEVSVPNFYAIDTGCVWGNCLTALRLDDNKRFSVPCKKAC